MTDPALDETAVVHVPGRPAEPGPVARFFGRRKPPLRLVKRLWCVHASGRFDRPDSAWKQALDYYRTKGILVTGTEAAGRSPELFRRALGGTTWDYAHLTGAALGECYATWDGGQLRLVGKAWAYKLTDLTWVRSEEYGGKQAAKVHALVVPLARLRGRATYAFVIDHDPLDNTPQRAEVWADVQKGKARLKTLIEGRYPNAEVVFVSDVNKNLRDPRESARVRDHIERPLEVVASWRGRMPKGAGTRLKAVLDMAFTRVGLVAACELLEDLKDSDHRAFRYRLRKGKPAF